MPRVKRLWITRLNAAVRQGGLNYNQFIHALKRAGVELNRKMLSETVVRDPQAFSQLIALAKEQLS